LELKQIRLPSAPGRGSGWAQNMSLALPRPAGLEYTVPVRARYFVVPSSRIKRISSNGGS